MPAYLKVATQKGLEPSTSGVTGQHSNQLSYWATFTKRLPTFPVRLQTSTIGVKELNLRVRNGNGCILFAIIT